MFYMFYMAAKVMIKKILNSSRLWCNSYTNRSWISILWKVLEWKSFRFAWIFQFSYNGDLCAQLVRQNFVKSDSESAEIMWAYNVSYCTDLLVSKHAWTWERKLLKNMLSSNNSFMLLVLPSIHYNENLDRYLMYQVSNINIYVWNP